MSASFLSIRGLRKTYDRVVAVENVSLEIKKGEFMTFLGPSGSGKSTTLYIIAGFQQPTEGQVLLDGRSLLPVPSNRRNIGMVFQRYTLFPHLTVGENVAFPLRVRRRPQAEIDAKVERMLRLVRLEGLRERMPAQLSGGQQQRVALARALAYDPPVLLMDEPLSALDKKLREEIQLELRRIHQETGVTILYVTHDQEEALRLSDRIAVFSHGRIEQIGTGEELYENPATHFVAGFVGNSNFLPVRVEATVGATARVVFPDGSALADAPLRAPLRPGDGGVLMVRPERMRIRAARRHDAGNGLGVTVRDMTYLGDSLHFAAVTAWNQELAVRMPMTLKGEHGLSVGAAARIEWDAAQSHVFAQH